MISLVCNVNASEFYSRKTLWSLEFEDDMGGAEKYTFAEFSLALKDGTLAGRYQESKPYMELNPFAAPIPASDIECIDIKISSKNDMTLKFYFKTNKEDNWSEERNFQIKPSGGSEMNIYSIDTSGIKNWDNSITRFRMDFLGSNGGYATNELNIDYIRALGGEGSSAKPTAGGILYDFEKNSKTDGWKFDAGESEADISDGKISVYENIKSIVEGDIATYYLTDDAIEITKISKRFVQANIKTEKGDAVSVTLVKESDGWRIDSATY